MEQKLKNLRIGFAMCGSFCSFKKCFKTLETLIVMGAEIVPIMSFNAYNISTRFGSSGENAIILETLSGRKIIHTIEDAEPIGPKNMTDVMLVANCTGNTLAKLAYSITDTPVTMAVKSHLRAAKPVVLSISTNDALAGTAKNIGSLMNYKNYFFVPMTQDDSTLKPTSISSDFEKIPEAIELSLINKQLQPMIF